MTSIEAVASYVPSRQLPIADLAGDLGLTEMQVTLFARFHRLTHVRWDDEASLVDLLLAATDRLDALRGNESRVRYVLHARAFPVVVPFAVNAVHEVCRRRGLSHAEAFTVTQHSCASGLLAIDLAGRLLAGTEDRDALALVLAGEKAFTSDAQLLPDTSVFSEGASACLIGFDGPGDRLLSYATMSRGDLDNSFDDGDDGVMALRFQREYRGLMAEVILAATARAGLSLDEITLILPHNVNLVSWRQVCKRLGIPVDRVFLENVLIAGHVFCADAFINHQSARDGGLLRPGDRYLVAAAGAGRGATLSAMVFEHPRGEP